MRSLLAPGSVPAAAAAAIVVFSADQHMAARGPHEVVIASP
jgi:hypothetical protein